MSRKTNLTPADFVKPQDMPKQNRIGADSAALVVDDLERRSAWGYTKYGTRLSPDNGRDALIDAYQEALDLCQYLRQELYERYGC